MSNATPEVAKGRSEKKSRLQFLPMAGNQRQYSQTRFAPLLQWEKIHFLRTCYYKNNTITIACFFTWISGSELEIKWNSSFLTEF